MKVCGGHRSIGLVALCAMIPLSVLFAGCVSPRFELPDLPLDGWRQLRAERFTLIGNAPQEDLERMARDLAYYLTLVDVLTNAETARVPARFYLVRGEEWEIILPPNLGGYIIPVLHGAYSVVGADHPSATTRHFLLHEYSHFLIRKGRALRYPKWYDEGLAELLGSTRRRGESVTVGSPAPGRLQALWHVDEIDVAPVLAASRKEMWEIEAFYAISWVLTHHLSISSEGRRSMSAMVASQASGLDFEEAYDRSFDIPVKTLSKRVTRHAKALQRGAIAPIEISISRLDPDLDWQILAVEPAQVACELGEVALLKGGGEAEYDEDSLKTAAALFERALELEPTHVRSSAGLAVAHARLGRFVEADSELARVELAAPDAVEVERAAGDVHRARALDLADEDDASLALTARLNARRSYARALRLAPGDVRAMAGAGWSYVGDDDATPGIEALEEVRRLGAWDARVALDLGHLYMAAGDAERARSMWMEVTRVGDEDAVKEATSLLEESGSERAEHDS